MPRRLRHSVADWLDKMTLGARLSLFAGLIVLAVVASVAQLEVRWYERHIDSDLVNAGRLAAQSAADAVAGRPGPPDPLDIRDALHDLVEADPVLDAISVVQADPGDRPHVFTSTSTEERAEVVDLAGRAIAVAGPVSDRSSTVLVFALPVPRHPGYAVAVTVGLESLIQARAHGLRNALGFALPTIVLVTLLVDLAVRRLVRRPLAAILRTMEATAAGDLNARTALTRHDELGAIAIGLNQMLDRLEQLNRSLYDRATQATRALSLRTVQLEANRDELRAARASLAHAERLAALGQLAATVAHEAGTPLNLVSGYVQMLREDPRTDPGVRTRLQTVDRQIQHVTRALRTMVDHARAPTGFEVVALGDVLERVREITEQLLARSDIALEISIAGDAPAIAADATQLEMVLLNLVTNAFDAMSAGGTLSIAACAEAGKVLITVADTGSGIPAEIMDRLFDPWVTTKPTGRGIGLGLAIVRDVVRAHGGTVSARNRTVGAVVTIELPAAPDPSALGSSNPWLASS